MSSCGFRFSLQVFSRGTERFQNLTSKSSQKHEICIPRHVVSWKRWIQMLAKQPKWVSRYQLKRVCFKLINPITKCLLQSSCLKLRFQLSELKLNRSVNYIYYLVLIRGWTLAFCCIETCDCLKNMSKIELSNRKMGY